MDERKNYAAFSIPPRGTPMLKNPPQSAGPGPDDTVSLFEAGFAEIEFEPISVDTPAGNPERGFFPSVIPARPIGQRPSDPIRKRFLEMHGLAAGNPFARYDAGLFYKQAKFMEDFSDDYQGIALFFMYYPNYQYMGYEQLRTFFSWRTRIRRGETPDIPLSYLFLYIYELLSNIGADNPADGLDRLMAIWDAYREREPELDKYLPGWLKDYHIYYELPHSFRDFIHVRGLWQHYMEISLFDAGAENSLALWNGISCYDITRSKFYSAGNDVCIRDCFYAVLCGIRRFVESRGVRMEDLPVYSFCNGVSWYPFQRALFFQWAKQTDRQVNMPGGETYYCKDNRWTADISIHDANRKEFAGYLLKKTEACLRQAVQYKYKITAGSDAISRPFQRLTELGIQPKELDDAIEKAVADFHKDMTRVAVTVDHGNLSRIRKESLGTRDMLIVPEDGVPAAAPAGQHIPELPEGQTGQHIPVSDIWAVFHDSLTEMECMALSMALRGGSGLKALADQYGVMLEVLADSINEKAFDHIGDSVLEIDGGIAIYEEYREKIAEMVE